MNLERAYVLGDFSLAISEGGGLNKSTTSALDALNSGQAESVSFYFGNDQTFLDKEFTIQNGNGFSLRISEDHIMPFALDVDHFDETYLFDLKRQIEENGFDTIITWNSYAVVFACGEDLEKDCSAIKVAMFFAGINLVYIGTYVDGRLCSNDEKRETFNSWMGTVKNEVQNPVYTYNAFQMLPQQYDLSFTESDYLSLGNGVNIPIPDGFHGTTDQSILGSFRVAGITAKTIDLSSDLMEAFIGLTVQQMTIPEFQFPQYNQANLEGMFNALCMVTSTFNQNVLHCNPRVTEQYGVISQNYHGNDDTYNKTVAAIWVNTDVYLISIIINAPEGMSFLDSDWDNDFRKFGFRWLSLIRLDEELSERNVSGRLEDANIETEAVRNDETEEDEEDDSFEIEKNILRAYRGQSKNVEIPDDIEVIGENAFLNRWYIVNVYIPDGIKKISDGAFRYCSALQNINIPSTVKTIGEMSFEGCTSLKKIDLPEGCESIGNGAFWNCHDINVNLPSSIKRLGNHPFESDAIITNNSSLDLDRDVFSGSDFEITNDKVLVKYFGKKKSVNIPDDVMEIGRFAFARNEHVVEVHIPDTCEKIGEYAFSECNNLEKVNIPEKCEIIEEGAFGNCDSLEEVFFSDNCVCKRIGNKAFFECCSLERIEIPESCRYIGISAFFECPLKVIRLPEYMDYIDLGAFTYADVETFMYPKSIKMVNGLGSNESLKTLIIDDDCKEIEEDAFCFCDVLESVEIPDGCEIIHKGAFSGCTSLKNVHIPESVYTIESRAFACCDNLTVYIPSSVKKIEYNSFDYDANIIVDEGSIADQVLNKDNYLEKASKNELPLFYGDYDKIFINKKIIPKVTIATDDKNNKTKSREDRVQYCSQK